MYDRPVSCMGVVRYIYFLPEYQLPYMFQHRESWHVTSELPNFTTMTPASHGDLSDHRWSLFQAKLPVFLASL